MPTPTYINNKTTPDGSKCKPFVTAHPSTRTPISVLLRRQKEVYKEKEYTIQRERHKPPFLCTIIGNTMDEKARTIWKVEHCGLIFSVPYWELNYVNDCV